jgi:hypothetical protein
MRRSTSDNLNHSEEQLRVREAQMKALESADKKSFENRTYVWLCKHWPDETNALGEAAVRDRIRKGTKCAQSYGLETEYQICTFLNLEFLYGPQFHTNEEHKWAEDILKDAQLSPDAKVERLIERTSAA